MTSADTADLPLALTLGEPAGIGPELILNIWHNRQALNLPYLAVFGCAKTLNRYARNSGQEIQIKRISNFSHIPATATDELVVIDTPLAHEAVAGQLNSDNGASVVAWIDQAVDAVFAKQCRAVVTSPIHKKALYDSGFSYPGHTEYLAHLAQLKTGKPVHPVMLIASDLLNTVPVTIHIPIDHVPSALTPELIRETIRVTDQDFRARFGITSPRIAVAGLNPHAGEDGSMGTEDRDMIAPCIAQLRSEGLDVFGPLPADTMFHARARENYDVAVCMYHDQALIPAKTLAFDDGVNVTLGLPFVRTSPDHGTALDIAGKNIARPDSLIAAIRLADKMTHKHTMDQATT